MGAARHAEVTLRLRRRLVSAPVGVRQSLLLLAFGEGPDEGLAVAEDKGDDVDCEMAKAIEALAP